MAKKKNIGIDPEQIKEIELTPDAIIVDETKEIDMDISEKLPDADMAVSEKVNEVVYSENYFESEILFKLNIPNPNLSEKFDFTDALIDLSLITGLERAVLSRLEELGLTSEESRNEYNIIPDRHPFIYSTAYPNGVLILDMTYDELKTLLVKFKS